MNSKDLLDNFQKETTSLNELEFPLDFQFKIATIYNDFIVKDGKGGVRAYVRQKLLKFKEKVVVYSDESKKTELYHINADRWIDFNAHYSFTQANSTAFIGSMGRKGMKSLWKASYTIFDADKQAVYEIKEENPWAKIGDGLVGELPIISMFTGYLFHPKYGIKNKEGELVARLSKVQSFFGRQFKLEQLGEISNQDKTIIMLSVMMMVLLERERG
jgi:hypothetical protein